MIILLLVMNMLCRSNEELIEFVKEAREAAKHGKVAEYIPALAKADPHSLSIAIFYPDGTCVSAGDIEKR